MVIGLNPKPFGGLGFNSPYQQEKGHNIGDIDTRRDTDILATFSSLVISSSNHSNSGVVVKLTFSSLVISSSNHSNGRVVVKLTRLEMMIRDLEMNHYYCVERGLKYPST